MTDFDPPASVDRASVVAAALAEDLGLLGDITSIACIGEDQTAVGGVRRARGRRARRHRARDRGVPPGRRRRRASRGASTTATRSTPGTSSVECQRLAAFDPHRRADRAQLPVPLLGRRVAHAPLRARRARQGVASATPARRCRDCARVQKAAVRAGGGFNHRDSLSDAVLIKDNHLAGARHRRGGRAGARALAGPHRRGRVRHARAGAARRATPAPTSCCSTT